MIRTTLLLTLLAAGTAATAEGQSPTRMVSGRIFDDTTGCPLAHARVSTSGSTGAAVSDARGHYHLANPPASPFTLMAMLPGYQMNRVDSVMVADTSGRVDFTMQRDAATTRHGAYPPRHCELEPPDGAGGPG